MAVWFVSTYGFGSLLAMSALLTSPQATTRAPEEEEEGEEEEEEGAPSPSTLPSGRQPSETKFVSVAPPALVAEEGNEEVERVGVAQRASRRSITLEADDSEVSSSTPVSLPLSLSLPSSLPSTEPSSLLPSAEAADGGGYASSMTTRMVEL